VQQDEAARTEAARAEAEADAARLAREREAPRTADTNATERAEVDKKQRVSEASKQSPCMAGTEGNTS